MLEIEMEEAVANCPDLFIEPNLTLVRRQVVINGRRPDVLFNDGLGRNLLVEIQRGRLDEDHLQRHCYYFYDYRRKYPTTHPRLMFIANRLVPQHKDFLGDHGYEYREIPEFEFQGKLNLCLRKTTQTSPQIELVTSPGVLAPSTYELVYEIESEAMTLSYKMILLIAMAELADADGRVQTRTLAHRFQEFFLRRSLKGKLEENPKRNLQKVLSAKSTHQWELTIHRMPVKKLTDKFLIDEGTSIRWAPRIWENWDPELQREILSAARNRLVWYFNKYAGGY